MSDILDSAQKSLVQSITGQLKQALGNLAVQILAYDRIRDLTELNETKLFVIALKEMTMKLDLEIVLDAERPQPAIYAKIHKVEQYNEGFHILLKAKGLHLRPEDAKKLVGTRVKMILDTGLHRGVSSGSPAESTDEEAQPDRGYTIDWGNT
jgi:hypothetical protein